MSPNFNGTTSRSALLIGMTNTDQVGMWQARAPAAASIPDHAEHIGEAGDGVDADAGGEGISEATGLTAEDQAAFDGMRTGDTPAGDPEPPDGDEGQDADAEADLDSEDADPADVDPATPPLGKEKTPEELVADAATGKKPAPKTVSFGKYQRELKKAGETTAAAQAEARKAREDSIKLAERVAIINEALTAPPPAAAVDPNALPANPFEEADIDPSEDYAAAVQQERRRNRFAYEASQGIQQDVTLSREDQQMRETFQRDFSAAAGQDPSVSAAYQFLKDSRLTEICISEFDKDPNDPEEVFTPQQVARMVQIFNSEEKYVVGNALKAGKSPTAAIVRLARARGFKYEAPGAAAPAARPAVPAVPVARNGTGRAVVPAPAAPSAAEQLAALAAAQESGKSLSDGGGAPPSGLTAQMLVDMGDDEFAELLDRIPQHQLNALLGRTAG